MWQHVTWIFHTAILNKMKTGRLTNSTNTSKLQKLATEDFEFCNAVSVLLAWEAGRFSFSYGKCCTTYQYAAVIYRCIKTCHDVMHFRTIQEKSGNSYRLEAEIFSVLRSLVYYKFQIWLVSENFVIKLSDICHSGGRIYGYGSILSFSVCITTI